MAKIPVYLFVRAMQPMLLQLEKLDKHKNDPFGWSVIGTKK